MSTTTHHSRRAACVAVVVATLSMSMSPGVSSAGEPRGAGTPWVAYQSSLRGEQFGIDGIFLVRPDGSDDHEVATSMPGQHIHPDWSSGGHSLVFRADLDYPQLFLIDPVADPTGAHARQLTSCAADCDQVDDAALSPHDSTVAYVEDRGLVTVDQIDVPLTFDLRVARITSYGLAQVRTLVQSRTDPRTHVVTELVEPRWSPDGRSLVFWADRTDGRTGRVTGTAVFTIHSDGTGLRQVTPWSMFAGEVDWSPDGKRLALVTHPLILFSLDHVVSNLYTARPDGSDLRQLTHATSADDRATQARWTADDRLIYTRVTQEGRSLWLRDADGGHPTPIAPGGFRTHGDLQPVRR